MRDAHGSVAFNSKAAMSSQTRDSLLPYAIAALATVITLYADVDFGQLFAAILARW
jgi:hypothetical protein